MKRDFNQWIGKFRDSISTWDYYVDFEKIYHSVDNKKQSLLPLNSLIGSKNIEEDFSKLLEKNPLTLKAMPILLAKRDNEFKIVDRDQELLYDFSDVNRRIEEYVVFMRRTGLFKLMEERLLGNILDYVIGVEVGMDTNARKNRTGFAMEQIVEDFLVDAGLVRDITYFKEMNKTAIQEKFKIDLSKISNENNAEKKFDFVVFVNNIVYGIEVNFYSGGGSKLNETARSYKNLAIESKDISNFEFIWITDGNGWHTAKRNLQETFEVLHHLYSLNDLINGTFNLIFSKDR